MSNLDDLMTDYQAERQREMDANEARRTAWLKTPEGAAHEAKRLAREAATLTEAPTAKATSCDNCGDDLNEDGDCDKCDN